MFISDKDIYRQMILFQILNKNSMNVLDGRDEQESVNNIKKTSNVVRTHFDK